MKVEGSFGEVWLDKVPEQVREAERLGFDAISTGEVKHNSLLALTLAAEHSQRLELCTGVTIVFPRSPMIVAQAAWDLQQYSRGRINIGFGSQVKGHNERRFSTPWTPPAQRMRDYIGMVRAVWRSWQTGEKPDYHSKNYTYTLMTPNFDPGPIEYEFPKISISAVGPKMAEVAGELADGLRPHGFMTESYLRSVILPAVAKGASRAGRSLDEIEISVGGFLALGERESDVEQAIDSIRASIAFYGSTRTYHAVFRHHGLEALGMQLHEMSLRGEWERMPDAVPFSVAQDMAFGACTFDKFPEYVRAHYDYASRISLGQYQTASAGRNGAKGSISEERLRWLVRQLQTV